MSPKPRFRTNSFKYTRVTDAILISDDVLTLTLCPILYILKSLGSMPILSCVCRLLETSTSHAVGTARFLPCCLHLTVRYQLTSVAEIWGSSTSITSYTLPKICLIKLRLTTEEADKLASRVAGARLVATECVRKWPSCSLATAGTLQR